MVVLRQRVRLRLPSGPLRARGLLEWAVTDDEPAIDL